MNTGQQILLGCDDAAGLFTVLNQLKKNSLAAYRVITATSNADLLAIAKSVTPRLVILSFRNLQQVLNTWSQPAAQQALPILCITRRQEERNLHWPTTNIVFTCPADQARHDDCLHGIINSILLLHRPAAGHGGTVPSFAEAAIQSGNTRNMSRLVLELDQKVDLLTKVKERLARLCVLAGPALRDELNQVVSSIKTNLGDQKLWEDFKLYFVKTNPNFLSQLSRQFPSLTEVDLKYCCYLKMNMSNDDIRTLLGINQESVRTHKYRLKKKLCLQKEESLRGYLQTIN